MIKLGVFFTITSFFGSGAFSIIANYLMKHGNAEVTGIYSAGYLLISYLGMFVFSAMESDYFPRLSAVNKDRSKINELVNRQAEVALLLSIPGADSKPSADIEVRRCRAHGTSGCDRPGIQGDDPALVICIACQG